MIVRTPFAFVVVYVSARLLRLLLLLLWYTSTADPTAMVDLSFSS
jgi:hypothetical protein